MGARRSSPSTPRSCPAGLCGELDLEDAAQAQLFCLVTVPTATSAAATANLRAPVVVNPATGRARQVVLADGGACHPEAIAPIT